MVSLKNGPVYLYDGKLIDDAEARQGENISPEMGREETMAYKILRSHDKSSDKSRMKIKFDSLTSHDITYVGIVQTARASGLLEFPVPYVLTNCHNSLCAVGGTLNEDDHVFGLSAAKKYGGVFVPAHQAVIHQYAREMSAFCGGLILGSDSHTRYGALGCMGVGEGGPELVKQLLSNTYDVAPPSVIAVYLEGNLRKGVGPHDIALAIIGATYENGFVKNAVMEFLGPGVSALSMDFRNGIDVMTTETTCLSSIWITDEKVREYYEIHGREEAYKELKPGVTACYDGLIKVDLSKVEPMIALPFHPSHTYTIRELSENPYDILKKAEEVCLSQMDVKNPDFSLVNKIVDGKIKAEQGIIAGCSGGMFENIAEAAAILNGKKVANEYFSLSVYPASQPMNLELMKQGILSPLIEAGALIKTAFCGPCFGAGDVPANGGLSLRHTTRNFPNREGSKPDSGQIASVALMDARSIAATAANGGFLTPATDVTYEIPKMSYHFNKAVYENSVYDSTKNADGSLPLKYGPNIADWPEILPMSEHLLLQVASVIRDPVTTTDELIPSGETSTYRSNPYKLAEFTLSRKDPSYVPRAKATFEIERARREGEGLSKEAEDILRAEGISFGDVQIASVIFCNKPGDGSAREQAASCQRVLGGGANIAYEYATKRYRSNLINWGMLPFVIDKSDEFKAEPGDFILIKNIKKAVENGGISTEGKIFGKNSGALSLHLPALAKEEGNILLKGCLINSYGD